MKKVLYLSNSSRQKTGFGRHARTIITELHKRGYEMIEVACGPRMSDPALLANPWKTYGTVPDNDAEVNSVAGNRQMEEAMFFGAFTIDRIIKNEKPDAVILVEDIWKIQWAFSKPWFNKIPTLIHTPIDSSPVLPLIKDNKDIIKDLWVKTDFAVKDLEGVGIPSKCVPLLTDQSEFRPLKDEEKQPLRKMFGIENSFVIGFVFRNQIRKLVVSLLRGFKEFKDKYPESDAKLLLHTNFDEGAAGWRIMEAAGNIGVNPDDILCTYICHKCRSVQVLKYQGVLSCGKCKTDGSLRNPSIDFGILDSELNAIYNMMDFYCHPVTSGGFEGPMAESSLAGIPSATCNYSFGQTFCNNGIAGGHSLPIKFAIADEINSMFMKSQPIDGAICEVIEEVYNNRDKYKEVGLKAREWALDKFSLEKGINEFQNWIDNSTCEFDYSSDFYDLKNEDYPPNYSIDDNLDFVKDLFSGVFGVPASKSNPDVDKFVKELAYKSRENVALEVKGIAKRLNEQQKPPTIFDFIKGKKKKLGIVCRGGAKECFSILLFLNGIKEKYSDYDIYICAKPENSVIFDHCDIQNFVPYHPQMEDIIGLEGRVGWDGAFDLAFVLPEHQHHNGII